MRISLTTAVYFGILFFANYSGIRGAIDSFKQDGLAGLLPGFAQASPAWSLWVTVFLLIPFAIVMFKKLINTMIGGDKG